MVENTPSPPGHPECFLDNSKYFYTLFITRRSIIPRLKSLVKGVDQKSSLNITYGTKNPNIHRSGLQLLDSSE